MSQEDLAGKVAIVTGAAQGMGQAIAETLAQANVHVVVSDINGEKAKFVADNIGALGLQTDVTSEQDVQRMVDQTLQQYGTIDILVNNAGLLRSTKVQDITKKEWDLVLDVNINGTFLCTQAVLKTMKSKRFGRIINLSSTAGKNVSTLGGAHYTTAKAAVLGFTRAVAHEVGTDGITVNAICPGLIDTEMVRKDCSPEKISAYENSFPIPRLGTPQEVADLVLFLAANAPYITGAAIDINGGDLMI